MNNKGQITPQYILIGILVVTIGVVGFFAIGGDTSSGDILPEKEAEVSFAVYHEKVSGYSYMRMKNIEVRDYSAFSMFQNIQPYAFSFEGKVKATLYDSEGNKIKTKNKNIQLGYTSTGQTYSIIFPLNEKYVNEDVEVVLELFDSANTKRGELIKTFPIKNGLYK